ncbi:MAG: BofC C-terminal domain-containing protein [[Clostridium] leptum]
MSALPPVDQELLEKGIRVSSKEDLNQLLEDLCS